MFLTRSLVVGERKIKIIEDNFDINLDILDDQ